MNKEQQRIEIAIADGWSQIQESHNGKLIGTHIAADGVLSRDFIPDYPKSVEAILNAFKRLGRHWKVEQIEDGFVVTVQFGAGGRDVVAAGFDLAEIMAEAFLKTLNLWTDE